MDGSAENRSQRHGRWGLSSRILWVAHFSSPPSTKRSQIRFLFAEPDIFHVEILSASLVNRPRAFKGIYGRKMGNIAGMRFLSRTGSPSPFPGEVSLSLRRPVDVWFT